VKRELRRFLAPRAYKAGAFCVGVPTMFTVVMLSAVLIPAPAVAQIPGIGALPLDTLLAGAVCFAPAFPLAEADSTAIIADSIAMIADSIAILPDSSAIPADSSVPIADPGPQVARPGGQPVGPGGQPVGPGGQPRGPGSQIPAPGGQVPGPGGRTPGPGGQVADSSATLADSTRVPPRPLPAISPGPGPSYALGAWCWNRGALLSTRAVTLAELVALVPGVISLKGGDYGTPVTVMAFGVGGGGVRVVWDGFEMLPLDGAVPDLSRIGLAGLDEVRVERHPGELRIELRTREATEADPITLLHVGTGDLGTNLLSGVFVHPRVFGGSFTLGFDRVETRGPGLDAGGSLSGVALRYAIPVGERGGVVAEMKRFAPRTDVSDLVTGLTRNDWNIRAKWRLAKGWFGEGYGGASSLAGGPELPVYGGLDTRRTQLGFRTKYTRGGLWAQGTARHFSGQGVPDENYEVAAGGARVSGASLDGSLRVERWAGQYVASWRARVETAPVKGFSLFAAYEAGETGTPFVSEYEAYLRSLRLGPPLQPEVVEEPDPRFTDRTGVRAGGQFSWRGFNLAGAWLTMEADSLRPLGLVLDPDGVSVPGGDRTGFEATATVPLPLRGFGFEAAVQAWNEGLPYLPRRSWDGALTYRGVFKESRNLELWAGLGVTGRDSMSIAILEPDGDPTVPDLVMVPRSEEWYFHIQVRIVTLNIFIRWENITGNENVDFPDRAQPRYRTLYGVRWIMNN